jgi:hypothetical protein
MLTIQAAAQIVRDCLRKIARVIRTVNPGQRLVALGIDNNSRLERFKKMIVAEAARRGQKIALSKLSFSQSSDVGTICDLLVAQTTPRGNGQFPPPRTTPSPGPRLASPRKKAAGKPPKKPKPPRPKAAKPKSPKAKQKIRTGRNPQTREEIHLNADVPAAGKKVILKPLEDRAIVRRTLAKPPAIPAGIIVPDTVREKPNESLIIEIPDSPHPVAGKSAGPPPPSRGQEAEPPLHSDAEFQTLMPPSAPLTKTVEATPQMEIRKELAPSKSYRLGVFVDQGPAAEDADVAPVKVEVSKDMPEFSLDVWLDCSSHFKLDEVGDPPCLKVNTETGVSNELGFTLNVIASSDHSPMFVSAFFRYNERPSGKITRFLESAGSSLRWKKFSPPKHSEGEVILPNADAAASVVVETHSIPADIRVEVLKTALNNGKEFTLKCYTPQGKWEGAWNLPLVSRDLVNEYMKTFMANKGEARIASLKGAGEKFWDALPKNPDGTDALRNLLWDALEKGARTMSVISEEPYIPWELIVPYRDLRKPRQPLGIELQLGRWITGNYQSARQKVSLKSGYIICPKTSGLTSAAQEVTFLTTQLEPKFDPIDEVLFATFTGVNKGLAGGPRNVIHFICHGKSAALQTLQLDTPDTLDCSQVRTLDGFLAAFEGGPLAFLNACEVGGLVLELDGVGGFANSFIEMGASAVIAPLWAVQDAIALDVTQTFYPQALQGVPFAQIMKQIRTKAYTQAIDSYAAYCFYGDPLASLA